MSKSNDTPKTRGGDSGESHDADPDDELHALFRQALQVTRMPKPSKPSRFEQRPEDIDRALAQDRITRSVRQRPRRAPPAPARPEIKREPFNAAEAFSIIKQKKRQKQERAQ